ncbi:WD repeat-containing protein, partial [Reticulomyxa filosa]
MLNIFRSSSKLIKAFTGHTKCVYKIDYSTFNDNQLLCSGSADCTMRVWDVDTNKQIQSSVHSDSVYCVKFSSYHYYNHHRNVICFSLYDDTIRFWDIEHNQQSQVFNGHTDSICCIEFSSFNNGRYLYSGSEDQSFRLWDVETSKSLHVFYGHQERVSCIDVSPLQSNNNNGNIGVIGGNGYSICSGSWDNTIRIWDIETTKQLI